MEKPFETTPDDGCVVGEVEDETVRIEPETNAELVFGKLKRIIKEAGGKGLVFASKRGPAFGTRGAS